MDTAVRMVQGLEETFSHAAEEQNGTNPVGIVTEALEALAKLEGRLLKEGLVGLPLANVYRTMAKWAERKGGNVGEIVKWKTKELEICVTGYGHEAPRTKNIMTRLQELHAHNYEVRKRRF